MISEDVASPNTAASLLSGGRAMVVNLRLENSWRFGGGAQGRPGLGRVHGATVPWKPTLQGSIFSREMDLCSMELSYNSEKSPGSIWQMATLQRAVYSVLKWPLNISSRMSVHLSRIYETLATQILRTHFCRQKLIFLQLVAINLGKTTVVVCTLVQFLLAVCVIWFNTTTFFKKSNLV